MTLRLGPVPAHLHVCLRVHLRLAPIRAAPQGCRSGHARRSKLPRRWISISCLRQSSLRAGQAASHQRQGWEEFTDQAIEHINREREGVVFFLWGSYAQKKGKLIDRQRHCVLTAPHPSPLSAHRGFLGCGHFSRANQYLLQQGKDPIDWSL